MRQLAQGHRKYSRTWIWIYVMRLQMLYSAVWLPVQGIYWHITTVPRLLEMHHYQHKIERNGVFDGEIKIGHRTKEEAKSPGGRVVDGWWGIDFECLHNLILKTKTGSRLPWCLSDKETTCQCRRHGFDPWPGKMPHAVEHLSPCTTATEPVF